MEATTTVQEVTAKTEVLPLESDQFSSEEAASGTDEQQQAPTEEAPDKAEAKEVEKLLAPSDSIETSLKNEVAELRKFVREQRLKLAVMEEKTQQEKKENTDEDQEEAVEKPAKQTKGIVTQLQEELTALKEKKSDTVDAMYEMMKLSPKYPDIESVVTSQRVSDIIEAAATTLAKEHNIPVEVAALRVEKGIWESKNPYANVYSAIKEYHPDYTGKKEVVKSKKPLASAPETVVGKGGASSAGAGWTAARIDSMPENELRTIPKEIYQQYMKGELK